jgi:hypothetical protein
LWELEDHQKRPEAREARRDDRARVDHRTFAADWDARGHTACDAKYLGHEHAQTQHTGQLVTIEVGLDVRDARARRLGGPIGEERGAEHKAAARGDEPQPAQVEVPFVHRLAHPGPLGARHLRDGFGEREGYNADKNAHHEDEEVGEPCAPPFQHEPHIARQLCRRAELILLVQVKVEALCALGCRRLRLTQRGQSHGLDLLVALHDHPERFDAL